MIILIGGEKGGTGKSTIATNLAAIHVLNKKDLILIDADKQGTSSSWSTIRDENETTPRVPCLQKHGKNLHIEIQSLSEKYDTIILDAGGRDSVELRAAMLVADRFYMPIRASQFDAWTLDQADAMIADAQMINPELKAYVVINQASTNPAVNEAEEIQEFIRDFDNIMLASSIIKDRIAFRKAAREGISVLELKPIDPKASAEIKALYKEVFSHE